MRKKNQIIVLTITLSFLSAFSALSAFGDSDSAPPELLGTWRVLGNIENGKFLDFTGLLLDTQIYMKIDNTNTTILIESEELDEEEIEELTREINQKMANPQKYIKIGDNAWRNVDSAGETSEFYLLGDYLCELDEDGGLGIAIR
jgi:hypothetical protein